MKVPMFERFKDVIQIQNDSSLCYIVQTRKNELERTKRKNVFFFIILCFIHWPGICGSYCFIEFTEV